MGLLRFRCFEKAGPQVSFEELEIRFQPPDQFHINLTLSDSKEQFFDEYVLSISDILSWPISSKPLLKTERLEIRLLLPSDEPEVIDFIQDPEVWQMRGDRYSPVTNLYSVYRVNHQHPWYRYYFAVQLGQSETVIGFISFYQISRPEAISPVLNQTPYESVMLSYALSRQYWRKGLMSEALSVCLPWFISTQNVRELIAFAEVDNQGSRRILQKLGLQDHGLLGHSMISPDLRDRYKFMLYKKLIV
ncbi:MAG: GNAT family N-acetyltransferase [Thainema sp.]